MPRPIDTLELFYAHALAIEREAAVRYHEFAEYFEEHDELVLAGLCRNLADHEERHFVKLQRDCRDMTLPPIDEAEYRWIDEGAPEAPAHELFYRVTNPHQLLQIALAGERGARRFFSHVARTTRDENVQGVARGMAREEAEHIAWICRAIEYREPLDWGLLLDRGIGPGAVAGH